jgi:hypothetical protein
MGGRRSPTFLCSEKIVVSWKVSTTRSKFSRDVAMIFSISNNTIEYQKVA